MSGLQTILAYLNGAFGKDHIEELAAKREAFAPGMPLAAGIIVKKGTRLYELWQDYLEQLPGSIQEAFRSIVYYALSTDPPTPITFAWAPGYDYELTIWYVPDTPPTRGGITLLLKSRYPNDPHPTSSQS